MGRNSVFRSVVPYALFSLAALHLPVCAAYACSCLSLPCLHHSLSSYVTYPSLICLCLCFLVVTKSSGEVELVFFNALDLTQLHAWLSHLGTIEDVVVDGSYFSLVILLVLLFVYVY